MNYLVDTNVFVRAMLASDPQMPSARMALSSLLSDGHKLVVLPQIVAELWSVATRPEAENGLGFHPQFVDRLLSRYRQHFQIRFETDEVFTCWRALVLKCKVRGKQTHDARLAAAVVGLKLDRMLTFNGRDFERYPEVRVVHPSEVG